MACRHRPAGLIVHSDIVQMVKIDISLLRSIKFTQRDIIASLILLIFIVLAVILLVGGSERTDKLDIPVGLLKDELSAKADISKVQSTKGSNTKRSWLPRRLNRKVSSRKSV